MYMELYCDGRYCSAVDVTSVSVTSTYVSLSEIQKVEDSKSLTLTFHFVSLCINYSFQNLLLSTKERARR